MAMQKLTMGTFLTIAIIGMVITAAGAFVATRTISNVGSLKSVGVDVYWDSSCTNPVSSIDWGEMVPGSSKQFTIYIKNNGNVPLRLSMTVSNWNPPSASTYMNLSWNCEGYVLGAGSVVSAVITLSVSSSITEITNFSFDITIAGTEST
ncbi:MAG: hypothetical protein QXM52_02995 [Candidatus Bathyarchaeia archaeon]